MAHARRPGLSDSVIGAALDETVSCLQDSDASYISVSEDEYDPAKDSDSESDDSDPGGGGLELFKGEITLPIDTKLEKEDSDGDDESDESEETTGVEKKKRWLYSDSMLRAKWVKRKRLESGGNESSHASSIDPLSSQPSTSRGAPLPPPPPTTLEEEDEEMVDDPIIKTTPRKAILFCKVSG